MNSTATSSPAGLNPLKALLIVIGTRPEAIKLAPIIRELRAHNLPHRIYLTGQHPLDMIQAILRRGTGQDMQGILVPPLSAAGSRMDFTQWYTPRPSSVGAIASAMQRTCFDGQPQTQPCCVIVQGDTTSALVGALLAYQAGIPIAHVEAGLRSSCVGEPVPEEGHRQMIARIAKWHFAPTKEAARNLPREGVSPVNVHVVGNTSIDAMRIARVFEEIAREVRARPSLRILVTAHRRELQTIGYHAIAEALSTLGRTHEIRIVAPGNPDWRRKFDNAMADTGSPLRCGEAIEHPQMLERILEADLIMTDSGGLQEEAPALGRPLVILRRGTERAELGRMTTLNGKCQAVWPWARAADPSSAPEILEAVASLAKQLETVSVVPRCQLNGDGYAAGRIVSILKQDLGW